MEGERSRERKGVELRAFACKHGYSTTIPRTKATEALLMIEAA